MNLGINFNSILGSFLAIRMITLLIVSSLLSLSPVEWKITLCEFAFLFKGICYLFFE
jgi:hypothetical protein